MTRPGFPFSAVVGQENVKLALLLSALDPRLGGVLLRGQKGSAKSTLARGLAELLPGNARFVELPVSASEDRVVGSFDLESALTTGRRRFEPGLLAAADGGVLYVDEVNLLPDHLVDVLLDVAASGINRVERDGLSETHPSRFVLIGSMNPEEGDLRPQFLDRFGLAVEVIAGTDPRERAEAVRRRFAFDDDPQRFTEDWTRQDALLAETLATSRPGGLSAELIEQASRLCVTVGAEGLRADLVICRAAAALAGLEGRALATLEDLRRVAPLALGHRRRRTPFEEPGIAPEEIDAALESGASSSDGPSPTAPDEGRDAAEIGTASRIVSLTTPRATTSAASGRRSLNEGLRGRQVGDRVPSGPVATVALGATVTAAVSRRAAAPTTDRDRLVTPADLREVVHEEKTANLIVLTVDASASMGANRRMEAVKGAVLSLLLDAYQRRDRVALVTFGGETADVLLRPTGSVEVARTCLAELATGGRTPLAAGIDAAIGVAEAAPAGYRPLVVLVSDGRATAAPGETDPMEAASAAAKRARRREVPSVVLDVEDTPTRLGLAAVLAEAMGARYLTLPELSAGVLAEAIRGAIS